MKVLWVINGAYPLFGGAQITVHNFLRGLQAERGWDVLLATQHVRKARATVGPVAIETYRDLEELKALVQHERPQVLGCGLDAIPDSLRVAARFAIPSILYLQSFEYCRPTADEIEAWGVSDRKTYPDDEVARWALSAASRVLTNSTFLRERTQRHHGVDAVVIHPEFDQAMPLATGRQQPRYITGICGHRYKGAAVFLALADAFPRERFLLVGDVDPALASAFAARPNVRQLGRATPRRFLAMSRIVLVPSLWPEPFGRIAIEAMASGIPTLASRVGGLAEIVGTSRLGVDAYRDPAAWADALAALVASEDAHAELAALGRRLAQPFMQGESTRALAAMIAELAQSASPDFDSREVVLCGGTTRATAYSMINARWASALAAPLHSGLHLIDVESATELGRAVPDVTVHHNYGENFVEAVIPDVGRLVVVRTWDFGPYPPAWVKRINEEADLLLVYSNYVRHHAIASGIPARKVRVVPLGVDAALFAPEGPTYELATKKSFRFLFVGAPVPRKGADILLQAYRQAFGPDDDVSLVIKDHPNDLFYEGAAIRDRVIEAARDPNGPEIEYICELLPAERLAALYRACNVGVFPYRAEGFCLPILEAMAAGLPSIVPRFGAALDYCSPQTSLLMPVRRISLPVGWSVAINTLGFREEVEEVEFCETPVDTLVRQMREAVGLPRAQLARRARAGVRVAHRRYSWTASAARLRSLIDGLAGGVPMRLKAQRANRARDAKRLAIAKSLLLTPW